MISILSTNLKINLTVSCKDDFFILKKELKKIDRNFHVKIFIKNENKTYRSLKAFEQEEILSVNNLRKTVFSVKIKTTKPTNQKTVEYTPLPPLRGGKGVYTKFGFGFTFLQRVIKLSLQKKDNVSLQKKDNVSLQKKDKLLIFNNVKKTKKSKNNIFLQNNFDEITISVLEKIMLLHHFTKHRKNTKVYEESLFLVRKNFKRYRSDLLNIFELANNYFSNSRFVYNPQKTISIPDFFKFKKETINRSKKLQSLNVKSWFNEFSMGEKHIEKHFVKRKKDRFPDLTKRIENAWKSFKKVDEIKTFEHNNFVIFIEKANSFQNLNSSKIKRISDIIEIVIQKVFVPDNQYIESTNFLISDYFWSNIIPKVITKWGLIEEYERINFL